MSLPTWLIPEFDVRRFGVPGEPRFSPSVTEKNQEREEEARQKEASAARKRVRQKKYYDANKAVRQAKAREYYRRVVKAKR